jgi:hypothetical protein
MAKGDGEELMSLGVAVWTVKLEVGEVGKEGERGSVRSLCP